MAQSRTAHKQARLPQGVSGSLRGIAENFTFHSSPESFIVSRIQQLQKEDSNLLDSRIPIRAKILNRNVAVISSYQHIQAVLKAGNDDIEDGNPPFIAASAYHELMAKFFPMPNLLLSDGCPHRQMRSAWNERMDAAHSQFLGNAKEAVLSFFYAPNDQGGLTFDAPIDLYEAMKELSWRIILKTFLALEPEQEMYQVFRALHEDLLRGQFSLMPIRINTRFWQSPRSKGVESREKLQQLILRRLDDEDVEMSLPLPAKGNMIPTETRDHVLMMTSSLAAKGLASLLTALLLNLFLFDHSGTSIFETMKLAQDDEREKLLRSTYLETERLSPPIVGVMRRVTRDAVLEGKERSHDTLLPAGWDAWLYFVGSGRDSAAFGETFNQFDPTRYLDDGVPYPHAFGAGPKSCLGKNIIQDIILMVARLCLEKGITIEGQMSEPGLRAWLGWEDASPQEWAAAMKQLPTQRPARPINVRFVRT